MKYFSLFALLLLFSCHKKEESIEPIPVDEPVIERKDATQKAKPEKFVTSVFDDAKESDNVSQIRTDLDELDKAGVFDTLYHIRRAKLTDRHFGFFKSLRKNFKVLFVSEGSLFSLGSKNDLAMVVYVPDEKRIAILLYNTKTADGGFLYRDYKVINGLEGANCHYSDYGTLDYLIASEITYGKEYTIKSPKSLLDNRVFNIGDFTKTEDYAPEGGCTAPNAPKHPDNVLALATSFAYNNWECLAYNAKTKSFFIYYGQAFAD